MRANNSASWLTDGADRAAALNEAKAAVKEDSDDEDDKTSRPRRNYNRRPYRNISNGRT